jgi:RNA polymerase sigma-70 factor (ECF subfamily)
MTPEHLPPEALLEHAAWLRRLAEGLVRGEGDADDLVQETWLAALRSPPRDTGPARGWLAEVLRNARRMRARSQGRRARREGELGVLVEPASPSPELLLARLEAQRRLAALVAELDEPVRSTILLRYFEGLSAAEIARREGVPAGTVRWRLKTGLDRLRAILDGESGGDRGRWGVLLAPLGGGDGAARMTVWKGILIMTSTTKVGAVVAAVALVVAAVGWRSRPPPPAKAPVSAQVRDRAARAEVAASPAPPSSARTRQARDEMRSQILESLRKRDAGAPPAPPPPAVARRSDPPPPPAARGHYEASYIQEHFREDMFPLLRSCYEDALRRHPTLGGKLVLSFGIVGDSSVGGVVEDADFAEDSDIQDDEMRTCVRESLMTLTFDKPPTGGGYVTVRYPIAFSPGSDEGDAGAADGGDGGGR